MGLQDKYNLISVGSLTASTGLVTQGCWLALSHCQCSKVNTTFTFNRDTWDMWDVFFFFFFFFHTSLLPDSVSACNVVAWLQQKAGGCWKIKVKFWKWPLRDLRAISNSTDSTSIAWAWNSVFVSWKCWSQWKRALLQITEKHATLSSSQRATSIYTTISNTAGIALIIHTGRCLKMILL